MDLALEASALGSAQLPVVQLPGGSVVKSPPAVQETQPMRVLSLSRDDALEEGVATHAGIRAWRLPRTEELWPAVHRWPVDATEHTRCVGLLVASKIP